MDSLAEAAANCRCSRVVYVGNIAFHAADKEVRDACELIGPVRSFHLAADAATGKRKGYAFVEYADDATAQSACRNLHGHLLRGRELRVGLAGRTGGRRRGDHDPVGMDDAIHAASLVDFSGQRHAAAVASVTRYLAGLSRHQLREAAAAFETNKLLKDTAMEMVQRLLDMAAADAAAEEAKRKRRESASAATADDHRAKMRMLEDGGKATPVPAGVACV
ncbi:splicing factor U2af large subunit A-like [Lolium rigidum]|uniref:splicing factor U2af large subunit A-like n=1 Tax=Lolium rigidum TaxID=89674 RepID=UPI001F5D9B23|nr:splicing factor U2af large subunit A-like [Lolium rigidum]